MRKERKHYTAEEKVAILRRHLLDKVPVSDLCEEYGLQPTVMPFGTRPFRVHIDPASDGAEIVNGVADRVRAELLRNMKLADLLRPSSTQAPAQKAS